MVISTKTSLIFIDDLGFVNRNAQDNPIKEKQKNKHSRHTIYNLRLHNINAYGFQTLSFSKSRTNVQKFFKNQNKLSIYLLFFSRQQKWEFFEIVKKVPFHQSFFSFPFNV